MTFNIKCPFCKGEITDKSFNNDAKAMAHLQEFFNSKEQNFKNEIEKKLIQKFLINKDHEIKDKLSRQELLINQLKQQEIDAIKEESQKKINLLNAKLSEFDIKEKTNFVELKAALAKKELEIKTLKQQEIDNIKNEHQKTLDILNTKINSLITNEKIKVIESEKLLKDKELEIKTLKQQEIDAIKEESQKKINDLTIKLEQGRNIRTGILGSNLENDFAAKMPTFFNEDLFEKTTKPIAGRKPDFKLSILNNENNNHKTEVMGSILFELKNQEIANMSNWESKLTSELEEWNAKFGIIIWTHAKAPFVRSTMNRQIFIVNTDLEIIVLIVNILKILIKKEYALETSKPIDANFLITQEKFKNWLETDFNKLIGKAHKDFGNFERNLKKLLEAHDKLEKIRGSLYDILINEVNIKIKNFI